MSVRGYTSYPFVGFGRGLNLRDMPDAVDPAECIDAMNVVFTDRGAIHPRPGYGALNEAALTNRVDSLIPYYTTAGAKQLLAGCGTRLEALSSGGAVIDSETGLAGGPWGFTRFGKPNAEVVYAGNGTDTLRRWNGVEWTAPTATVNGEAGKAMPKAGVLCAWPAGSNRLIATRFATGSGGPDGAISSPDHIYISDEGDPTSWSTVAPENHVQMFPGDGEAITAAIAWRELVFVFKESRFIVLDRGVTTDVDGNPEFLFRPVEAGVGAIGPRAVCADESGVYFLSRHGVYRTTGQEPEEVSHVATEPIFTGETSRFYTGGTLAQGEIENCVMHAHEDLIFLSFPTDEANDRTLVYDRQSQWWSITDLPCAAMATFRVGASEELVFGYASGENLIGRHSRAFTTDDGEGFDWHWRSGWFDLDNPDVKTLRSSKLWGEPGTIFCAISHDWEQSVGRLERIDLAEPASDKWGGTTWGGGKWAEPGELVAGDRRVAVRGTVFSTYFTGNTATATGGVHRITHHLREIARPSETKA